jgi:hypothetical protein
MAQGDKAITRSGHVRIIRTVSLLVNQKERVRNFTNSVVRAPRRGVPIGHRNSAVSGGSKTNGSWCVGSPFCG